jgi:hypothetical protein
MELAGSAEKVTVAPVTGLSNSSITLTLGGVATAVPTMADWLSPPFLEIFAACPAVPVAVKVNDVVSFAAEAVSVFDPAVWPNVQLVMVAVPSLPVVTDAGDTLPPPVVTVNVTGMSAIGALFASLTITLGGIVTAVSTVADWLFPIFNAIEFAADTGKTITSIRIKTPAKKNLLRSIMLYTR